MAKRKSSGWSDVGYGLAGGFERDRKLEERKRLQDLASEHEKNTVDLAKSGYQFDPSGAVVPLAGSETELLKQQNQILMQQIENAQRVKVQEDTWKNLEGSIKDGNLRNFNSFIRRPEIVQAYESMDIYGVESFDPNNEQHRQAYLNAGMDSRTVDILSSGQVPSGYNEETGELTYRPVTEEEKSAIGMAYPLYRNQRGDLNMTSMEEFVGATNLVKYSTSEESRDRLFDTIALAKKALSGFTTDHVSALTAQEGAKAGKETAEATMKGMEVNVLTDIINNPDISDREKLLAIQGKLTDKDESPQEKLAKQKVEKGEREEAISRYIFDKREDMLNLIEGGYNSKVDLGGEIGEVPAIEIATIAQGDNKPSSTEIQYMDGMYDAKKSVVSLYKELQGLDRNALKRTQGLLASVLGTDMVTATEETKEKLLTNFEFNAKLKTVVAAYIKAMSGAAVTDSERKTYANTIMAGNWSNKDEALASMKGFATQVDKSLDNKLTSLKHSYPKTYMEKQYQSGMDSLVEKKGKSGHKVGDTFKQGGFTYTVTSVDENGNITGAE